MSNNEFLYCSVFAIDKQNYTNLKSLNTTDYRLKSSITQCTLDIIFTELGWGFVLAL